MITGYYSPEDFLETNSDSVFVVFEPTQIKSTTNEGTFDPNNPDIRYMPLADTKFSTAQTQFRSRKLKGALGGEQDLVHFSSVAIKVLDPKTASGKGAATPTDLRGLPRGYFYRAGKSAYETGIAERSNVYIAKVDGNSIYDLNGSDPLGYRAVVNKEKADQMLRDAGFSGMRGKPGAVDMVAMFEPVKLTPATPEDVYTKSQLAAQRRQAARTQGPDIDYNKRDRDFEKNKPKPFRLMPESFDRETDNSTVSAAVISRNSIPVEDFGVDERELI